MSYGISPISSTDRRGNRQVDELLKAAGIRRDGNLDYTCGMFDEDFNLVATGSCFGPTLRCLAVDQAHQGEGLMAKVVTHLTEVQCRRGHLHLFLYTKCSAAAVFRDLGFYEIARAGDEAVFMENRAGGFSGYLASLGGPSQPEERAAAIVMNANPFTLGHLHLVERACGENDRVHLFIVSEEAGPIPAAVRKRLVLEGTAHLKNLVCHDTGPYLVSAATFPSYFQRDEAAVIHSHAGLDAAIFLKIARALGVRRRYVGEEPASVVTGIYNDVLTRELPKARVECVVIPRKAGPDGKPISASTVRQALQQGDFAALDTLVPPATLDYFRDPEAQPVLERIRSAGDVVHY